MPRKIKFCLSPTASKVLNLDYHVVSSRDSPPDSEQGYCMTIQITAVKKSRITYTSGHTQARHSDTSEGHIIEFFCLNKPFFSGFLQFKVILYRAKVTIKHLQIFESFILILVFFFPEISKTALSPSEIHFSILISMKYRKFVLPLKSLRRV